MRHYATASGRAAGPYSVWPDRHPEAAATHAHHYEAGRQALCDELVATGDPRAPFPAKVFAFQRPDGVAYTSTTWTEGVTTLLPAADVIVFVEQPRSADPIITNVRWDVVAEICADSCWAVQPDLQPIRLLTTAWPSPEQLAELKARKLC
jgi:hypothetical protein